MVSHRKDRDRRAKSLALRAGMMAVNPQGTWHRFPSPDGVTLMTVTPYPSEVVEVDVDDPRTAKANKNSPSSTRKANEGNRAVTTNRRQRAV